MSVVDAWLSPMSTTVREEYEVGDLDPSGCARSRRRSRTELRTTRAFRKLQLAAHWADLHPATTDTGVETFGGAALLADESLGGDGTPAVAAFTPEPFALALGMSPSAGAQLIADALDLRHRLPMLWKRLSRLGGAGLAGPTGRPPDPPPAQGRRDLGRRTARRPRACGPVDRRPLGRPSHRGLRPRGTRRPRERSPGRLGRHPHPPRGHRLPRHLPPRSHRRHPGPQERSTTRSAASPTSCTSTATPPARRPQGQGPRHPHRPTHRDRASRRSRCTPASRPATSNPTPSPSARSRSSAPPPSPRSAPGSATTKS